MREFLSYFKTGLFAVFLIVLPLIFDNYHSIFRSEIIYCGTMLFFCLFMITNQFRHDNKVLDYVIVLFLLVSILNIIFVKNGAIDRFIIYKWGTVAICYFIVKQMNHNQLLLYALVVSGCVQSIIAILQKFGILSSKHIMFELSGSFHNPGQLGGYLAVCIVISICLLINNIKNKNLLKIFILSVCIILQLYAFYLADSRAAFLGLMIGLAFYFLPKIKKHKKLIVSTVLLVIIFAAVLLYFYRPASANGRLLIWQVSMEMISDKPFFGHGIGSFPEKYMLYQANYFSKNPNSVFISVADNVSSPFNELLNITAQQGLLGLVLLLAIFYLAFNSKGNRIFKAALVSLTVFSMFSYPTAVFPILLLFAVFWGGIGTRISTNKNNKIKSGLMLCFCLVMGYSLVKNIVFLNQLSGFYETKNMRFFEQSYEKMRYNRNYHDYYLDWLIDYPDSEHSNRISTILPSCENYYLLGKYFLAKKNYQQAENALRTAADMIPTRIRPKYLLWQLYVETENIPAAIKTAQNILATSVKVESVYTLQVKAQMKKYLAEEK
jgi:O-antigen ligase